MISVLDVPVVRLPDSGRIARTTVCEICAGGHIICIRHPTKPLAHNGCEGAGMPCPRCAMKKPELLGEGRV